MAEEHRYRNLKKEEQIRCILRLLELLARSNEIGGESRRYRERNDQRDGETDKETNKKTRKQQQKGRRGV